MWQVLWKYQIFVVNHFSSSSTLFAFYVHLKCICHVIPQFRTGEMKICYLCLVDKTKKEFDCALQKSIIHRAQMRSNKVSWTLLASFHLLEITEWGEKLKVIPILHFWSEIMSFLWKQSRWYSAEFLQISIILFVRFWYVEV